MVAPYAGGPWFPAKILSANDGLARLEWYSGNQYAKNQRPKFHPKFDLIVQSCAIMVGDVELQLGRRPVRSLEAYDRLVNSSQFLVYSSESSKCPFAPRSMLSR